MYHKLKPLIYVGLAGITLSLISFFFWINSNKTTDNFYFGAVESVSTSTISITDKFNGKVLININENTKIFSGKEKVSFDNLKTGKFVQIIGIKNLDNSVEADAIRIMKDPKKI